MNPETGTRRIFGDKSFQPQSKRRDSKLTELSPEARKAMLLAREDTKENFLSISKPLKPPLPALVGAQRQNTDLGEKKLAVKKVRDQSRGSPAGSVKDSKASAVRPSRGAQPQPTARSRSTLSHSDRTETQNRSVRPIKASNFSNGSIGEKSVHLNTGNSHLDENNAGSSNIEVSIGDDEVEFRSNNAAEADDWENSSLAQGEPVSASETSDKDKDSFALALHRALDDSRAMRLRGDITDQAGISEPGTVRALNGGRLTNAQEVVVNVCYDDGKELVFHDDDYDSLETAKTISEIRINVWLEYNEKYRPDCVHEQEDTNTQQDDSFSEEADTIDFGRSLSTVSPEAPKTSRNTQLRGKTAAKSTSNDKSQPPSRFRSAAPSNDMSRSKTTMSPARKEPFLRRKAKA